MKFADVIVPLAVDGMFTYSVPSCLEAVVRSGALVVVSFAGNKKYTGVVCRVHDRQPEGYKIKPIECLAEEEVYLGEKHLGFLLWVSNYYMATAGEVVKAALPVAFRLESFTMVTLTEEEVDYQALNAGESMLLSLLQPGESISVREAEKLLKLKSCVPVVRSLLNKGYVHIKETIDDIFREKTEKLVRWKRPFTDAELQGVLDSLKRAPVQYRMLCKWIESGKQECSRTEFLAVVSDSVAALKGLCEKNVLDIGERVVSRLEMGGEETGEAHALSEQQQVAIDEVRRSFETKDCVLFRGVTSSGKTEIYIHLIREYIERGYQVLYMLPEIALTIQIVKRLRRVFGDRVGVYHSGMSDSVRAEMWKKQCSAEPYQLILGVRSSVFLPFGKPGLIIVDEEHEGSYKQKEPAPRYNGRDAAIMLGKLYGAKVLLGSATPSFETYHNAVAGKYGYVVLDTRYGNVQMPEVLFADVSEYRRKKQMKGSFTPLLYEEMKRVLDDGMQVILFQNRRGYSTYLQCDKCGAIPKCKHCDVSMTYYKQRGMLSCHYCGSLKKATDKCDACGEGNYRLRTPGTERIEEEVAALFPESRVARMDLSVMGSKARFRQVIDDFEQGKTNVLIGTQMVSKGLDFERVKLVGVVDADSMVHFPDFRAEERAYNMLMQVSGRSGRKGDRGKVVIQVADIKNRVYTMLAGGDFDRFFAMLSDERKWFAYPPFFRLIQVELRHKDEAILRHAANWLAAGLRTSLGKRVFGPAVPDVGKIGDFYRVQLLLKIEHGAAFSKIKTLLKKEFAVLFENKVNASLRVFCDVDP